MYGSSNKITRPSVSGRICPHPSYYQPIPQARIPARKGQLLPGLFKEDACLHGGSAAGFSIQLADIGPALHALEKFLDHIHILMQFQRDGFNGADIRAPAAAFAVVADP